MRQVLFHLPIVGWPIFGYGAMLFVAFILCMWLATWRAQKEGVAKEAIYDLAPWLFFFGILGARITYMIQYQLSPLDFFKIWEGGLVIYGSVPGALAGYFLGYHFVLHKYRVPHWKLADIIAPCAAVGICLGRVGCFLNGCCYGNVACQDCPAVHFPLCSPARHDLVSKGYQTAAGFSLKGVEAPTTVDRVEPGSPASEAGLRDGDLIVRADDHDLGEMTFQVFVQEDADTVVRKKYDGMDKYRAGVEQLQKTGQWILAVADPLSIYLDSKDWPRGKTDLTLTVRHADGSEEELPPYSPETLGLHPTQVYESISMALVFFLLMAFYPFRRHNGEVMVLFMLCYPVHRFLDEILRKDTDPVAFGMTLSQNGSILLFVTALVLGWWLWRKPVQYPSRGPAPA